MVLHKPFTQAAPEMTDANDNNKTDDTLRGFGRYAVALRHLLDEGKSLNYMELLFVENHFHVVQMAFLRWKWKHRPILSSDPMRESGETDH